MRLWTQDDMRADFCAQFPGRRDHGLKFDQTKSDLNVDLIIDTTTGDRFTFEKDEFTGVFRFRQIIDAS